MTAEPVAQQRAYRDTIGRFATGVTVVTWDDGEHVRGMTANAVASLSLDPMLLLVCVDKRTTAHEQLNHSAGFAVNILAYDQREVSQAFARHGVEDMSGVPYHAGVRGAPLIDNVLAWLECEVAERLDGGDHTIFVGRVTDLAIDRPDAAPLLFYAGRYRELGPEIT